MDQRRGSKAWRARMGSMLADWGVCTQCGTEPRRAANQRRCKACHATYMRGWRAAGMATPRAVEPVRESGGAKIVRIIKGVAAWATGQR